MSRKTLSSLMRGRLSLKNPEDPDSNCFIAADLSRAGMRHPAGRDAEVAKSATHRKPTPTASIIPPLGQSPGNTGQKTVLSAEGAFHNGNGAGRWPSMTFA